jgi:HEAT repeat protein
MAGCGPICPLLSLSEPHAIESHMTLMWWMVLSACLSGFALAKGWPQLFTGAFVRAERQAIRVNSPNIDQRLQESSPQQKAKLLASSRRAMKRVKLIDCLRLIKFAEDTQLYDSVPALCHLLLRPSTLRGRLAFKRPLWTGMRVRAIQMLRRFADDEAVPSLISTLLYDTDEPRRYAAAALEELKHLPFPQLQMAITTVTDWEPDGMSELIAASGKTGVPDASALLVTVLSDKTPLPADRWARRHAAASALCGGLLTLILMTGTHWMPGMALTRSEMWMLGAGMWALVSCLCGLAIAALGVLKSSKQAERALLHSAAADSLIALRDPSCVPALVDILTGRCSRSARLCVQDTLKTLLQYLSNQNRGILEDSILGGQRRLSALLRCNDGALLFETVSALSVVGTTAAIAPLEKFVTRKAPNMGREEFARAKMLAQGVLSHLQKVKRGEEDSQVLLRQADGATVQATQLVRPAYSGRDDSATLLKPFLKHARPTDSRQTDNSPER